MRAFAAERLDRLRAAGGGDVVAALFKPLPSLVVGHYLGVPEEDRARFDDWSTAIVAANAEGAAEAAGATAEPDGLLRRPRRAAPARARRGHRLPGSSVRASPATTRACCRCWPSSSRWSPAATTPRRARSAARSSLLAADERQRALLVADHGLVPDAVEEVLRLTSPVQGLARTTTRTVSLHGRTIPRGCKVLLLYAAGNRDPRKYGPDAEELDLRRRPTQVLTFSQGHHHCLGAAAARLQVRVTLEEPAAPDPPLHGGPGRDHLGARRLRTTTAERPAGGRVSLGRSSYAGGGADPRRRWRVSSPSPVWRPSRWPGSPPVRAVRGPRSTATSRTGPPCRLAFVQREAVRVGSAVAAERPRDRPTRSSRRCATCGRTPRCWRGSATGTPRTPPTSRRARRWSRRSV
ncbi:cytochrome P450 [Nocardioides convexus]|uniref:cytochrome P450 n=1 Tax=Nocardioides convexus TaxID=2712224 RepID=UPI0024184224|nr:cytochrome P450 [Nocardioides convexus]